MKIGVVGCGALGSFYGAQLCRAGHQVHFLLRSDFETVLRDGVSIRSYEGDFSARPFCARLAKEIGPCDLVLIGLKTTANNELPRLLPPLVGGGTAVLTLQNGLGNEEALAALTGPERVFGGRCFVCLNRVAPGVVVHSAHGRVVLGEFRRPPSERAESFAAMFRGARVRCEVAASLERAHWEKLVWNVPFNGLGVAAAAGYEAVNSGRVRDMSALGECLATDRLLADPRWEGLVRELMLEIIAAGSALGFPIPEAMAEEQITRTRCMGAYKASTLIDFERRQPIEIESLFLEPLRQARRAGVPMPRLAALAAVLQTLDPARRPAQF